MTNNSNTKPTRAAIYIRVSTDDQRRGYSPEFQLEDCRKAAIERDGCTVTDDHVFDDSASGGTDKRVGWQRLMEVARRREIDTIYFWKLDRMMRSERHFYRNEEELERLGIQLRFATQNLEDPFTRAIHVAVAAEERRKILERTQRGRNMAAKAGKWVFGAAPYGYILDKQSKQLRVVAVESKWVRQFFKWVVEDKLPLSQIQRRANEMQIPCYTRRQRRKEELKGYWHKKSIARILSNPIYTGIAYVFRFKGGTVGVSRFIEKEKQYPPDRWIAIKVPRVITQDLFDRCQEQLKRNREGAARNLKNKYLYNKLIYCGQCNLKLYARTRRAKGATRTDHRFYQGKRGTRWERAIVEYRRCGYCGQVAENRLEPIWRTVESLIRDPIPIVRALSRDNERSTGDQGIKTELQGARRRLAAILSKKKKLNIIFLEKDSMGEEEYRKIASELKREEGGVKEEIARLEKRLRRDGHGQQKLLSLDELRSELKDKVQGISYDAKAEIIRRVVNRIRFHRDKREVEVELNVRRPIGQWFGHSSNAGERVGTLRDERLDVSHPTATWVIRLPILDLKQERRELLWKNRRAAGLPVPPGGYGSGVVDERRATAA